MQPIRLALSALTAALASSLALVAACGSSSSNNPASGQDSGQGDSSAIDTGSASDSAPEGGASDAGTDGAVKRLAFPKVINWGDPQMTSAKVVTITFQGDTMAPQLAAFGQGVTQSAWWGSFIGDYCQAGGGPCMGQPGVSVALNVAAGTSYTDTSGGGATTLQPAVAAIIEGGSVPPPDANTLYLLYFPSTTTINLDGQPGCSSGWDGYHGQLQVTTDAGSTTAIYGVVMECPMYQVSDVTNTASHEIAESATDGYAGAQGNGGWYLDLNDVNTWGWNDVFSGGEVGDLCVDQLVLGQDITTESYGDGGSFTAQRIWSTSGATAGNPCVPVPSGEVYFSASPEKAFFVMDVGQTRTFPVTAFANGTFPSWTLTPQDWTDPNTAYLQLSVSGIADGGGVSVSDGTVVTVTMKLLADPSGTYNGEADGVLMSTDTADPTLATKGHVWPFAVMTTAAAADAGVTEPAHRRPRHGDRVRLGRR
jgi:hypothetical protein